MTVLRIGTEGHIRAHPPPCRRTATQGNPDEGHHDHPNGGQAQAPPTTAPKEIGPSRFRLPSATGVQRDGRVLAGADPEGRSQPPECSPTHVRPSRVSRSWRWSEPHASLALGCESAPATVRLRDRRCACVTGRLSRSRRRCSGYTVLLGMRSSGEPTIGWAIPRRPTAPWPPARSLERPARNHRVPELIDEPG